LEVGYRADQRLRGLGSTTMMEAARKQLRKSEVLVNNLPARSKKIRKEAAKKIDAG